MSLEFALERLFSSCYDACAALERFGYSAGRRGAVVPSSDSIHSNGRPIENPTEQKVVNRISSLRERSLAWRGIAEEVGVPVVPGSFKSVQRALQRNV